MDSLAAKDPADNGQRMLSPATVADTLKRMIVSGELLPGNHLRQADLAKTLGVSRIPIREALQVLTADGLVRHTPHAGYAVTRLSRDEFSQIYMMRRLLEGEVIMSLPQFSRGKLAELREINQEIEACGQVIDLAGMRSKNTEFHFAIFRMSPLQMIVDEVERLWMWALPYHAVYLADAEGRKRILSEHSQMIDELAKGNNLAVVELMSQHRHGSEVQLDVMLSLQGARLSSTRT